MRILLKLNYRNWFQMVAAQRDSRAFIQALEKAGHQIVTERGDARVTISRSSWLDVRLADGFFKGHVCSESHSIEYYPSACELTLLAFRTPEEMIRKLATIEHALQISR